MSGGTLAQHISYLDFEIEIGTPTAEGQSVAVLRSPAGEARAALTLPFTGAQIDEQRHALEAAVLAARDIQGAPAGSPPAPPDVRAFGQQIFEALLPPELRSLYYESQVVASHQQSGVRVKLRIQPNDLLTLPWELAYDDRAGEYVCLSRETPIVRYLELPQLIRPLHVERPIRLLIVIAGPTDLPTLNVAHEQDLIAGALKDLTTQHVFEVEWLINPSWRGVQQAFQRGPWHVLHFVGHGDVDAQSGEGIVALVNEQKQAEMLSATQLARLLGDHDPLRLAVLNACQGAQVSATDRFSSIATSLVRRGTPAVVAMQFPISDSAAIEFSRSFYSALAQTLPIDAAVAEARKAISLSSGTSLEWATPVLFMRSPDGVLFTSEPVQSPPAPSINISELLGQIQAAQQQSNWTTAIELGEQALTIDSSDQLVQQALIEAYLEHANLASDAGDFDRALADLSRVIALAPADPRGYYLRGLNYHQCVLYGREVENYDRAIEDFSRAIALDPQNPDYFSARATSYQQLAARRQQPGDTRAIDDYTKAIALQPEEGELYYARGLALKELRRRDEAQRDFERAVALGYPKARSEISWWRRLFS